MRQPMPPLGAAVEPLGVEEAIHLGARGGDGKPQAGRQRRGECLRILPPAFEARPVAGRERGRLVEEEQLGIAAPQTSRWRPLNSSRQQIHCRDAQRRAPSVRSSR